MIEEKLNLRRDLLTILFDGFVSRFPEFAARLPAAQSRHCGILTLASTELAPAEHVTLFSGHTVGFEMTDDTSSRLLKLRGF
jgi:hypothetical protein